MLKWMLGVLVGGLATYAYYSEQTRERLRQQLASATASPAVRGGVASMASVTTSGIQRVAQVVDSTPLPPQAKERARSATVAMQSAADRVTQQVTTARAEPQPPAPPSAAGVLKTLVPEDVLAEQDATSRAAQDEQQARQAGA